MGLGQLEVAGDEDMVGANWITTTEYEIHPLYDDNDYHNDLAIITLPSPVNFTAAIRPICLPQYDLPMTGHNVTGESLTEGIGIQTPSQCEIRKEWMCVVEPHVERKYEH